MAKLRGYKVIGTCSKSKVDIAKATGVDELIVYYESPGTSYEDYSSVDLVPKLWKSLTDKALNVSSMVLD